MSDSAERAGKILIISIVLLSVLVILISLIHLYAKWFCYRREQNPNTTTTARRSRRHSGGVTILRRGLSPSVLQTLAVIPFDPKSDKELECAVCLAEVVEGEMTRMLPKCNHGFHVECIDMWFYSHATCPICRNPVSVEGLVEVEEEVEGDFPANILFWGDETEVSTLTSQLEEAPVLTATTNSQRVLRPDVVVIDIPVAIAGETDCDEDHKSPAVSSRMRSLTRILSDL